jgi:MFS family permease
LIDHWGPKPVLLTSLLIAALGMWLYTDIHNFKQGLIFATVLGLGEAGLWPAQSAIAVEIADEHQRERYFGMQFAILNLGIGIGGAASSLIVKLNDVKSFYWLYRGNAFSFLIFFVVALFITGVGHRTSEEREERSEIGAGWKDVIADKKFLAFWGISIGAILFGYAQLDLGFATFANVVAKVPPATVGWAYAVNTTIIASCQLFVVRFVKKLRKGLALYIAITLWICAWIVLAMAGVLRSEAIIFIIGCQIVFAMGEMVWSPITPSVVNELAPEHLRGRYNSAVGITWQIGSIIGPVISSTLLGANLHWVWIGCVTGGLFIVSIFAFKFKINIESRISA